MKQFYPCGWYQYQLTIVGTHLEPKMVWSSLIATLAGVSSASSSHITIRGTAAKTQLPVRKILLLGALTLKCCSQMDFIKEPTTMERTS